MSTPTASTDERIPPPRKDAAAEGAVETVIDEACRTLHLPTIRSRVEDMAAAALRERASYKDFLADLLEAEVAEREERRKQRLVREANFPRPKRLEDFDFAENPNVTPELLGTLADPAWVKAGQPLCLIGDRYRQVPSADRDRHRDRRSRTPGPLHDHSEPGERAGRGSRREETRPHHRPLRTR